ncbi:hypothetical protein D9M71_233320 [compost metagenome]
MGVTLEDRPVVARRTDVAVTLARPAEHDVVAALGIELVVLAAADVDIVAGNRVIAEGVEVVARRTVEGAEFHPVVTLVTHILLVGLGTQDEVVALAAEGFAGVFTGDDEVVAEAAEDQVDAVAALNHVVAIVTLDVVVATHVRDDVVAVATIDEVVAVASFQAVIAAVAIEGVVALAGAQDVVAGTAAQHHMLNPSIQQVVAIGTRGRRVVADHIRQQRVVSQRVVAPRSPQSRVLQVLGHLEGEAGGQEDHARQVGGMGVGHDQLAEGVTFQLGVEVQSGGALQVIEAVTVLEFLQLVLEHEVEGRTQHAAEGCDLLGQATDPEVHQIETGFHASPCASAIEEVQPVARCGCPAEDNGGRRRALVDQGAGPGDGVVGAVGRDEVDQRLRMLEVHHHVGPTDVGLQVAVAGGLKELRTSMVEARYTGVATAGDVQRRQIQRQAH